MSPPEPAAEDARTLAAEFVLGLVQSAERDALAERLRDDRGFAREVAEWEARLGPLASDIPPEEVSPLVWDRIAVAVGTSARPRRSVERPGLWNSLAFWRGLGLTTSALAAACLALLLYTPQASPSNLVATVQRTDGRSLIMASFDRGNGRVVIMPASDLEAPSQHTHELWFIPPGGQPRSLGTFDSKKPIVLEMPPGMTPHANSALAISVEPMGGSTTGAPTGPVVGEGEFEEI